MRSAIALFCDDIRVETTQKRLLIGVYQAALVVPAFPTTIGELKIFIVARTPMSDPFKKLALRIVIPGREDIAGEIPDPLEKSGRLALASADSLLTFEAIIGTGPFEVTQNSKISVTVSTEREEFLAGNLDIVVRPAERVEAEAVASA